MGCKSRREAQLTIQREDRGNALTAIRPKRVIALAKATVEVARRKIENERENSGYKELRQSVSGTVLKHTHWSTASNSVGHYYKSIGSQFGNSETGGSILYTTEYISATLGIVVISMIVKARNDTCS